MLNDKYYSLLKSTVLIMFSTDCIQFDLYQNWFPHWSSSCKKEFPSKYWNTLNFDFHVTCGQHDFSSLVSIEPE